MQIGAGLLQSRPARSVNTEPINLPGEPAGVQACLEEAPTQRRMAFVLREVEGFATPEICKILGVTRTNLGVLLYGVRNRLRERLEARGLKGYPQ